MKSFVTPTEQTASSDSHTIAIQYRLLASWGLVEYACKSCSRSAAIASRACSKRRDVFVHSTHNHGEQTVILRRLLEQRNVVFEMSPFASQRPSEQSKSQKNHVLRPGSDKVPWTASSLRYYKPS